MSSVILMLRTLTAQVLFLGLGMQPPAMTWGVLLKAAQNVHSIALAGG